MILTPFIRWPEGLVLLLASRSPRRAELLTVAGIPFEVAVPGDHVEAGHEVRRDAADTDPATYAEALAEARARAVAEDHPGRLVLGADTIVLLDGMILEKPVDAQDARRLLSLLSGRRHTVITALALVDGCGGGKAPVTVAHERTRVCFIDLEPEWIAGYIATGEPMDKAGAYGIQGYGALMVASVEGCYFNVMGLPLARLGKMLRDLPVIGAVSGGTKP